MPPVQTRPNSEIEPIVGIQFGIFSPEEIERRSVVEITTQNLYDGTEPKIGGLFDPRMGVIDNGKTCRSCGQSNHNCPGHFGHYRLARPVYYIQFIETILDVLSCVCVQCSKLLIDKELHKNILRRRGEGRWKEVKAKCKNISRCGQETEDGCGARQPKKYTREGIARIMAEWDKLNGAGDTSKEGSEKIRQHLEVEYVLRLFRRITDEDVDFMGFSRYWSRPDWMICTVLPIPPPQVRPSVIQDNNQRSEDDLTHKLYEIIKTNTTLRQKIETNQSKQELIDEFTEVLQYHIATLVDNQIPGVAPSAQRSGRPLKSIQQRLGSKEGRIRFNIQGKRVEFSARSVITPDPNLSIGEIGVPEKIAKNLTVPEKVTRFNMEQMYKYVQNGADTFPGAKTVVQKNGRMISLRHINRKEIVLQLGDTVNRHLMDGDIILFNRQPTLHRMSMMGHRVKVLPYNTFRLNVSVTAPYNADFDGDEMNAHIPQSYEAAVELAEIAAVPHQIVSPRLGIPVIGIVQDTLVGSYRLTRPSVGLTRREFMNLMMWNKRFEGRVPKPRGLNNRYTGQQVISQLLPPINLELGNKQFKESQDKKDKVVIKEGDILSGQFDKDIFSKPSKGIIHVTYNDYTPKDTVDMIDALQNTVEQFLVYDGFSVGISDLVADQQTRDDIDKAVQARKKEVENIALQVHLDLFENNTGKSNQEEFENKIYGVLNKANEEAGKIGQGKLAEENRLVAMVKAGSKGNTINIAQMVACLGQIAIEGKRVQYGYDDRTLPHYKKYDDGAEARGFVESSFIRGLTPQEFFFHAMSGREGLIDTAVKTATTGYIQRRLIKAMEDLCIQFDGTVRDARNNLVQYHYGEDGINATKIESVSLNFKDATEADIRREYGLQGVDFGKIFKEGMSIEDPTPLLVPFVESVLADRKMLIEGVFKSRGDKELHGPVNIERALYNLRNKFNIKPEGRTDIPADRTDLQPLYVLQCIDRVLARTQSYHKLWAALVRFYLAPHKIIKKERFSKAAFDTLCEMLVMKNWQAWAQPGELVGIIAAQSIGEPSTQMTLNTFHLAGVAAKSNMTRGVPRLEELLKVTHNPKAVALTVFLKPEFRGEKMKAKAREVSQDLELTLLRDITLKTAIYFDPKDDTTILPEDRDLIKFYKLFELGDEPAVETSSAPAPVWSKWILRFELDREKMFNKNITMDDISYVLESRFPREINSVYSDFNSTKLVMRLRLLALPGSDPMDDLANLKKFQNRIMNSVVIRGLPGIKAVSFRKDQDYMEESEGKYKAIQQYVLETDGTNFLGVMNHPAVDGRRVFSTHPHDIYENLGVEATRATLMTEIEELFQDAPVNTRHIGLLTDVMTRTGRLMSVDRYGINKNDIGPLAKASFEETESILLKAAQFGEVDPITGVSANIMMGQTLRGGTSFSQILLDESALLRLLEGLPPLKEGEEYATEDVEGPSQDEIDEQVYGGGETACSQTELSMNVTLPPAVSDLNEPDATLEILGS